MSNRLKKVPAWLGVTIATAAVGAAVSVAVTFFIGGYLKHPAAVRITAFSVSSHSPVRVGDVIAAKVTLYNDGDRPAERCQAIWYSGTTITGRAGAALSPDFSVPPGQPTEVEFEPSGKFIHTGTVGASVLVKCDGLTPVPLDQPITVLRAAETNT